MGESYTNHGVKFERVDQLVFVREERKRLAKWMSTQPQHPRARWAQEWLAKSDEEHVKAGDGVMRCDVCGSTPKHIWHSEFSFCDEYGCGMDLCDKCILVMAKAARAAKRAEKEVV